ncbi:hypothetical protein GT002_15365 [Streptomyces sp. SID4917]|nr:hypothetical protein [Streptomyces sp. SID4917]MYZ36449.1 hypothetical protein [Streptomyces sp. SID4917]
MTILFVQPAVWAAALMAFELVSADGMGRVRLMTFPPGLGLDSNGE